MRTTAERYIDATAEAMKQLAKANKCTEKFVYMALTYRADTEKARKIRYAAVKEYGAIPMCHYPECETLHDNGKIMRQVFQNGATLRVDKNTGEAWITDSKGREVERRQNINIPELTKLQVLAEND
ncbi:MAG: hypothetical protein HDS64_01065 [Bacteroidales bacterium]|nr:hypothetical protein [Bacteroidales bacterium]MBD5238350.1 hypothetical protein [Bacteroidales bacterium]MBD5282522.1 hypothetical protein [Bacteroides sp.]